MTQFKNIKPLFDYILVQPVKQEEVTASGIVLPDSAKEKPQVAEVKAVGKDAKEVKAGMKVVYKKWGGNEIKIGQEEWTLIKEEDVMGIVE